MHTELYDRLRNLRLLKLGSWNQVGLKSPGQHLNLVRLTDALTVQCRTLKQVSHSAHLRRAAGSDPGQRCHLPGHMSILSTGIL